MTIIDMENEANELFIAYLENSLSDSDRNLFEKRLNEDSEFSENYYEFKSIYVILENRLSPERASVLETIGQANTNYKYKSATDLPEKKVIVFKPWKYGIAATILLAVGLFLFNNFNNPTYADYATHENISLTLRSDTDEIAKNAETSFNTKNYEEAINYFNELLKTTPENLEIQYFKAVALIETSNYKEADSLLTNLSNSNSVYASKAKWLNALSYLKQKRYDEVKEIINTIPSSAPEYKKAQKLLSDL